MSWYYLKLILSLSKRNVIKEQIEEGQGNGKNGCASLCIHYVKWLSKNEKILELR